MKKVTLIAMALCLAVALAVPALAETTVDVDGYYRARGWMYDNINTNKYTFNDTIAAGDDDTDDYGTRGWTPREDESQSFYDQRLRFNVTFNANDKVRVVTRWTAMNNVWGSIVNREGDAADGWGRSSDAYKGGGTYDPYLDYAFMVFETGIGQFKIGQMPGGEWGNSVFNAEYPVNRIQWGAPIGSNWVVSVFTEKLAEFDGVEGNDAFTASITDVANGVVDADADSYVALAVYRSDMITSGWLLGYGNVMAASENGTPYDQEQWGFTPFVNLTMGPFKMGLEVVYNWGQNKYDAMDEDGDENTWIYTGEPVKDRDIEQFGIGIDLAYNFGMGEISAGYAYASGQDSKEQIKNGGDNTSLGGIGADYAPLFYFTSDGKYRINAAEGLQHIDTQAYGTILNDTLDDLLWDNTDSDSDEETHDNFVDALAFQLANDLDTDLATAHDALIGTGGGSWFANVFGYGALSMSDGTKTAVQYIMDFAADPNIIANPTTDDNADLNALTTYVALQQVGAPGPYTATQLEDARKTITDAVKQYRANVVRGLDAAGFSQTGFDTEVSAAGAEVYWLRVQVNPTDTLQLWSVLGKAETTADRRLYTDAIRFTYDPYSDLDNGDSYGWEFDLGLNWQIMDNLSYTAQFAYVDFGEAMSEIAYLNTAGALGRNAVDLEEAEHWKSIDSSAYMMMHQIRRKSGVVGARHGIENV
jgi:hypothetical protein